MSDDPDVRTLVLRVEAEDAEPDELDAMTRQLLAEIRELDVEDAHLLAGGAAPAGAKAAEMLTLGALAVAAMPPVVEKLVGLLLSWIGRGSDRRVRVKTQLGERSVEVEFSPGELSKAELQELVGLLAGALTPGTGEQP